ncbi:hypothetical protein KA005_66460 [bacterium]|nr:hypothetical protein [bacterium]
MGLQKGDIWCVVGFGYKAFPGYYVDDGIMAVYCAENGTWTVSHVPSGYAVRVTCRTQREAVKYARRIRPLKLFDWYETDRENLSISSEISVKFHAVGNGQMTPEEFNVWVMMHKMGEIEDE